MSLRIGDEPAVGNNTVFFCMSRDVITTPRDVITTPRDMSQTCVDPGKSEITQTYLVKAVRML